MAPYDDDGGGGGGGDGGIDDCECDDVEEEHGIGIGGLKVEVVDEEIVPLAYMIERKQTFLSSSSSSSKKSSILNTTPAESKQRQRQRQRRRRVTFFSWNTMRRGGCDDDNNHSNFSISNYPYLLVVTCVILLLTNILTLYQLWMTTVSTLTSTSTPSSHHSSTNDDEKVIYGHIHMAKTAGTTINGELASHFERVCGHKGYSYDSYQLNERLRKLPPSKRTVAGPSTDLYKRGQVPTSTMAEIGHEDCDWISYEVSTTVVWRKIASRIGPLEVHVPCRDPVDHLLSQCNHRQHRFDCSAKNYTAEIEKCLVYIKRFQNNILTYPNMTVKCFNPLPIGTYVDYMSKKLQRKRVENRYVHRETNVPRNKTDECLLSQPESAAKARDLLVSQFDYYNFCDSCMSSPQTNLLY